MPEFAAFMIEVLPSIPFYQYLNTLEIWRHLNILKKSLNTHSYIKTLPGMSVYPSLGAQDFYVDHNGNTNSPLKYCEKNIYSQSNTFLDTLISDHSRFKSFAQNTRIRR